MSKVITVIGLILLILVLVLTLGGLRKARLAKLNGGTSPEVTTKITPAITSATGTPETTEAGIDEELKSIEDSLDQIDVSDLELGDLD